MVRAFSRKGGWRTIDTPYRSGLEDKIADQLKKAGVKATYEKHHIAFTKPATKHKYTPDFILPNGIIVEAKGLFEVADRKKHLLIKEQYPDLEIRFVFSNPRNKIYKGSKTSYADWCEKNGYKYAQSYIPSEWILDKKKYPTKGLVKKK